MLIVTDINIIADYNSSSISVPIQSINCHLLSPLFTSQLVLIRAYGSILVCVLTSKNMKGPFAFLLILVITSPSLCARITLDAGPSFNVVSYGANGDGHDDSNVYFY